MHIESPYVVVIRGYPATGKSTVSAVLRDMLCNSAYVSIDSLMSLVSRSLGRLDHDLAHAASRRIAELFLENGMNVILEDMFITRASVEKVLELAVSHGCPWRIFELEAPQAVCEARNEARRYPVTDLARLLAVLAERYYFEPRSIRIDTSIISPEQAARLIICRLSPPDQQTPETLSDIDR